MTYKNALFLITFLFLAVSLNVSAQTVKPQFAGGKTALDQYMYDNLKIPEKGTYIGGSFVVKVKFLVSKTGKLSNIKSVTSSDGSGASMEYINEAERFVRSMPNWIPGKRKGVKQAMYYTLLVDFEKSSDFRSLVPDIAVVLVEPTPKAEKMTDDALDMAEVMPEFPGGQSAMNRFIMTNLVYPVEAADQGIQGKVIVSFIVEKDGSLSNIRVTRAVDPLCDKAAIKVIKAMPKWNPGMIDGVPVRVNFIQPFVFKLQE